MKFLTEQAKSKLFFTYRNGKILKYLLKVSRCVIPQPLVTYDKGIFLESFFLIQLVKVVAGISESVTSCCEVPKSVFLSFVYKIVFEFDFIFRDIRLKLKLWQICWLLMVKISQTFLP